MPPAATEIPPAATFGRMLDPVSRATEILFGLIMVLTFTLSIEAAKADRADVWAVLVGMLGCNLAWAIIDAVMYLMGEAGHGDECPFCAHSNQPAAGDTAIVFAGGGSLERFVWRSAPTIASAHVALSAAWKRNPCTRESLAPSHMGKP